MNMNDIVKKFSEEVDPKWWNRKATDDVIDALADTSGDTIAERIFNHITGSDGSCEVCGSKCRFRGPKKGYDRTCSRECREARKKTDGTLEKSLKKAKHTNLERYGVENPQQSKLVKEKTRNTNVERYGVSHAMLRPEVIEANKNRLSSKDFQTKMRNKFIENNGVTHWTKIPGKKIESLKFVDPDVEIIERDGSRITIRCSSCGPVTIPYETLRWRSSRNLDPCPDCLPLTSRSNMELEIGDFVESLGVNIVRNDRSIISPMELDVVVPDRELAIEFCGIYWHSVDSTDRTTMTKHRDKLISCREAGHRLITIFEDEWVHKRDLCESMLRNSILHSPSIYARSCSVDVDVSVEEARDFCERNHIQGYAPCSIRYGLRHDGDLVMLMTFSRRNISKGSKDPGYEISRMCSSDRVVGGASKLFKVYKTDVREDLITYSDLRWGEGEVYEKIGMTRLEDTPPNYWYVDGDRRLHRFSRRKDVLVRDFGGDPDKTEAEIAEELGLRRIYDCGHAKYVWVSDRLSSC